MYAILINHILFYGKVLQRYKHKGLHIILVFFQWYVSSFALVSCIVGYKSNRYSNLLYIWLCTLFYSVIIFWIFKAFKVKNLNDNIFNCFFPVIFQRYWYFTKYFGMYLLLPIINKGICYLNESELQIVVYSTLGIFVFYSDLINQKADVFSLKSGRSTLWFLIFYITGAYTQCFF